MVRDLSSGEPGLEELDRRHRRRLALMKAKERGYETAFAIAMILIFLTLVLA